ncbi:MAG: SprT-like domain-containing protein [Bacteroidia bacterium]|nr:SprT-like domain-containing protein [Bacteroidia bacterium]
MTQEERNFRIMCKYIPEKAAPLIVKWVTLFDFKLKITKERNSKLGDYRPPYNGSNHQITINHNLNKYSFLVTLVHEIAHLTCYNNHGNKVNPHGEEWKKEFKNLMSNFLSKEIFPDDVLYGLMAHMRNPAASSCSDPKLLRILKRHDEEGKSGNYFFLEKLPYKTKFLHNGDRLFEKGEKRRTRFSCTELATGNIYLFHALAEVELFEPISHVESSFKIEF